MKNKFYLPMISLLATVTFMFSSCDNDDSSDTTKPLIELHEPEGRSGFGDRKRTWGSF